MKYNAHAKTAKIKNVQLINLLQTHTSVTTNQAEK